MNVNIVDFWPLALVATIAALLVWITRRRRRRLDPKTAVSPRQYYDDVGGASGDGDAD